jgi:DNA modification methylase
MYPRYLTIGGRLKARGGERSGLIACERLGRRCAAIELDPRYIDVGVRRWQEATGREATLDGVGFATIAEKRRAEDG